jgi:hypothetical protein
MEPPPLAVLARTTSRAVKIFFWLFWSINALIAAVVLYFFFQGLADGSVSSFNMLLWLALLAGVALVVVGSLFLRAIGKPYIGLILLLILALPGLAFGFFFLVLILSHPRWN